MEPYAPILILIIAFLCKRNYELSRTIKGPNNLVETLDKLTKKHIELLKANEKLANEVERQKKINLIIVEKHNELCDKVTYMPPESGRYFSITLKNHQMIKNFSEN